MSELAMERAQVAITPMQTIQVALDAAIKQGSAMDVVTLILDQQRWMMENSAKMAFNQAMHAAQQEMKRIGADATNPQTRSKYATYNKLDAALRPIYSKHGFSIRYKTADSPKAEHIRVVCVISHGEGHSEESFVDMPCDGKGAKGNDVMTKTHAAGSALSYGMRYLLKMAFNVAVGETDDDGNGAGTMPEGEAIDLLSAIDGAGDLDELKKAYFAALKAADDAKDPAARNSFINATNVRKAQLQKAGAR